MSRRRVVITGLGPVTPLGIGVADFWNALLEGRSAVRRIQAFDPGKFREQCGSEIDNLKLANYVPKAARKSEKIMARDIILAVAAAHQAITDAGLRTKCLIERGDTTEAVNVDSTRMGANIGAGLICADLSELAGALASAVEGGQFSLAKWGTAGMENLTPLWLLKFLPNMLACHVTIVHDCQGPSNTITCGEASSHLAIGEAFRTIERGTADVCICGGAESKANPMALLRQSLGGRLSKAADSPATACKPFAATRDGTVTSEGGGLVILESLEHAKARGARIYAEIAGFGAGNDAVRPTHPPTPRADGSGVTLAVQKALKDAGIAASQVDLFASAACGLKEHDAIEATAIRTLLGDRVASTPVLNIRGGLGNNGAGSGAIDFIATTLALFNNTVPHAINSDPTEAGLGIKVVTGKPVDAKVDAAVSVSYALSGGQNAAIVIKRYRD
ncbi:MAG: beta-ketoacyl-[acyl-carrier-protein] synthase family protein [Phycisphaerae bacterium]